MPVYRIIGLMSGSSLDGLDIAYCEFEKQGDNWNFEILNAATIPYSRGWADKLKNVDYFNQGNLSESYGNYLAENILLFIEKNNLRGQVDLISSHGHTIYHQPEKGITCQIGDGNMIANKTGINTVWDLRAKDVALGGQGAPIVPIGDKYLFKVYKYCLNIGGIANISDKKKDGDIIAFDICAANQLLNYLANKKGLDYDEEGKLARRGSVNKNLLDKLNDNLFYSKPFPKSLSNEWLRSEVIPLLKDNKISIEDKLATVIEHIAEQVKYALENILRVNKITTDSMLITGGGTFNLFLIEKLRKKCKLDIVIPSDIIVNYKEALAMAFMGVLNIRNEVNCLASVTGAKQDSVGGVLSEVF